MKTGLVMEGGAMRGMFTCGVIDVLMENGITFDGAIGVSAGAAFGCNYKSHQIGRAHRYNKRFCKDKRYASWNSWLKTGDYFNADFCYYDVPFVLDPWDIEAFHKNPMEFIIVATNCETGKPVYYRMKEGGERDVQWIRASASMPLASRVVEIGNYRLLDGGITDPIPLPKMEMLGYERNVVIETQPKDYIKKKQKSLPAIRVALREYPELIAAMARRFRVYNWEKSYIRAREEAGTAFVIRPLKALEIKSTERDPKELERVYQIGRETALAELDALKEFLGQ